MLHISQIAEERVEKVTDYLSEGEVIRVKCLDVDQRGRIKLSLKEAKRDDAAGNAGDSSAADSGDACNVDNACSVDGAEHAAEPTAESAPQDGGESQS